MPSEAKFIGKARLTKQGQLTLPHEARTDLDIPCESELYWYELNNSLILVKELINEKDLLTSILNDKNKKRGK